MTEIREWILAHQDREYKTFQAKLIPSIEPEQIIGVRTPELRAYAKQLRKENRTEEFFKALPHQYFEENQLHAFLLSEMKDYYGMLTELERFLPYMDNWATCDQLSPKIVKKHPKEFLSSIKKWLHSEQEYTVRFGIKMLLSYYLDDTFDSSYLEWVAQIKSDAYYVNMMIAWYFATALAKQYEATLPLLEAKCLDRWVQNKSIQKARECRRISRERKEYLNTLKIKETKRG